MNTFDDKIDSEEVKYCNFIPGDYNFILLGVSRVLLESKTRKLFRGRFVRFLCGVWLNTIEGQ